MANPSNKHLLDDPLSDITRKERRNLLLVSVLGILVSCGDMMPKKISAIGIVLTGNDHVCWILGMLILTVLYFLVAFLVYGSSDLKIWWEQQLPLRKDTTKSKSTETKDGATVRRFETKILATILAYCRIVFEFIPPIVVSGAALYGLFCALPS